MRNVSWNLQPVLAAVLEYFEIVDPIAQNSPEICLVRRLTKKGASAVTLYVTPAKLLDPMAGRIQDVLAHLGRTQPIHMVPTSFVLLDMESLPRKLLPRPLRMGKQYSRESDKVDDELSAECGKFVISRPLFPGWSVDLAALPLSINAPKASGGPTTTTTTDVIRKIWNDVLQEEEYFDDEIDFFEAGGSSLLAGKLVAAIRKETGAILSAAAVFSHRTIKSMAELVHAPTTRRAAAATSKKNLPAASSTGVAVRSPENGWFVRFVQLLPLAVIYPIKRIVSWTFFVCLWLYFQEAGLFNRFQGLIVSVAIIKLATQIIMPLIAILAKRAIIGKYKAGKYEPWSSMYLRWWVVDQILDTCGRGIFLYNNASLAFYYRMLGASIGVGAIVSKDAIIREYDLIKIGAGAAIDSALVRAFAVDKGGFVLRPITVGEGACIGPKCIVAPGTSVAPHACMGPLSSSYEAEDADPSYRRCCSPIFPSPECWRRYVIGWPCLLVVKLSGLVPILYLLFRFVHDVQIANGPGEHLLVVLCFAYVDER
jgi:acetyltransferase-like isoleucine patch superfamily enzyme/acyl carrier protein